MGRRDYRDVTKRKPKTKGKGDELIDWTIKDLDRRGKNLQQQLELYSKQLLHGMDATPHEATQPKRRGITKQPSREERWRKEEEEVQKALGQDAEGNTIPNLEGPTPIPSGDPSFQGGTQIPPMSDVDVELLQQQNEKNERIRQFTAKQEASTDFAKPNVFTLNYNNPEGFSHYKYSSLLENNNFNPYSSILQSEGTTADIPDTSLEPKIEAPAPEPEVGTDAHRDNWLKQTSRSPAAKAFEEDDPRRADWDRMRYEQMLDHKGIRPAPKSEVSTGKEIDASTAEKNLANKKKV